MRMLRVLVVSALAVSTAALVAPAAAEATPSPTAVNAITFEGTSADPGLTRDDVYSGAAVSIGVGQDSLQFAGNVNDGTNEARVDVDLAANNNTTLTAGTSYAISDDYGRTGTVNMTASTASLGYCATPTATSRLTVDEIQFAVGDPDTITEFAGSYSLTCEPGVVVTGELRYNSTLPYDAVSVSPRDWYFGTQLVKANGIARTFTFTNSGAAPVTYGSAAYLS